LNSKEIFMMTISAINRLCFTALALSIATVASGNCVCACISGEVQAICQSSIDVEPICAPRVCPIAPPAIEPITAPRVPPVGTSECGPRLVYDDENDQYVWTTLCE
jgi:hypothetical protein